jgi:hypothetical protein
MAKPRIPDVAAATNMYAVRHFRFPIDVVNHENKLGVPPDARMTCGQCKRFETPSHITEHHGNRSGQLSLFSE